ncbi:MAG: ShlB/FhaC/HecB family hemolysin secretion/activation protein [Parachlamydiales bacterium]|nr:ShlB/FhaC/HecB family hemolysin secretion/activation protein [Parachlamydiales bacterium]
MLQSQQINSITLIDHIESIKMDRIETEKKIQIERVYVPNEEKFVEEMNTFIGKEINLNNIEDLREKIQNYYIDNDYPLMSASIPPSQDISRGDIQVVVIVSKLDCLKIKGVKYSNKERLRSFIRTYPGNIISNEKMKQDLYWINYNPFRDAAIFYEKGEKYGTTKVTLDVKEKLPFRIYGEYENTGNLIAGDTRYITGFNWGNVFGLNHQLNYQFITSTTTKKWWAHTANYVIQLPWRNIFKIVGFISETKSNDFTDFRAHGKGWNIQTRYEIPLIYGKFIHTPYIGYDFKRTNNFVNYALFSFPQVDIDVSQFILGYHLSAPDSMGLTYFRVDFYISPGGMTKNNKTKNFEAQRAGAKSNYFYFIIYLDRTTTLKYDFSWIADCKLQLSSGKLIPSEQLSLGGVSTIRGYKENEIIGDNGFYIKNEIRTPKFPFIFNKLVKDNMQFLTFLDLGWVTNVDQSIYNKKSAFLGSLGLGFRYAIKDNVTARLDYGWQLKDILRINEDKNDHSRAHVAISVAL